MVERPPKHINCRCKIDLTGIPKTEKMVEQLKALCDTAQRTGNIEYLPGSSFIEERKNAPRK